MPSLPEHLAEEQRPRAVQQWVQWFHGARAPCATFRPDRCFKQLTLPLGFLVNPSMHGGGLFAQAVVRDPLANFWGVATTNLVQHQILAPFPPADVGHVYLAGLGTTGGAQSHFGVVVRFQ